MKYSIIGIAFGGMSKPGWEYVTMKLEMPVGESTRLEESERRYRALVLASSDAVYRMSPDWKEMRELLGRDFLADTGTPSADWLEKYIHPDDQPHVMEVITEAIRSKTDFELEHRVLRADGTIGWTYSHAVPLLNGTGEIIEWIGAARDVTGRKVAEEAVKESERKFSTFFHAASVLMGITTFEEGRLIDLNEVALQALGYSREEIMGTTLHHPHIWADLADRERVMHVLKEKRSIRDLEITIRGKDGQTIVGLLSAELVSIDGEDWVLSVVRDITLRKRAEEEVRRLNVELAARARELEVANRELEGFNYMVAHDLRNPLNTMSSSCQAIMMMCGDGLPQECREFLQTAYRSTTRMNRLIGVLLDFSRMAHVEPHREKVDVSAMAKEVASELRDSEPGRDVEFRIAEGLSVDADANLLRIVLDNLLGNAWKYTPKHERAVIEFGAATIAGEQVFFVRDNGRGLEEGAAEKIFVPFQRLPGSEMAKGFGIGLATVERIIQRHGGRIWAEGEPAKGACFNFTLK